MKEAETDEMGVEQWLAIRKEAGLKIDPETAEVDYIRADLRSLRGLPDLPEEYRCWTGEFRPFSRKRHMGQVWRFAQGDP